MPKNIRVYELARELGMTNAEVLDLCESLGIGVKSHSSGIVEAQADRARRKAQREGLVRDVQPEEPGKKKVAKPPEPDPEPEPGDGSAGAPQVWYPVPEPVPDCHRQPRAGA
ncbi:MAG: translation initiation factor IF-2 N-terminal domain-containing protein, partial [Acidimicrobiales bacterium]|nr:translation initiation factor IF-2 N-terminal domain-containing protein [Acidimicrobiales bacterium]